MAPTAQTSDRSGELRAAESGPDGYSAFHPRPLPPDPPLSIDAELQGRLDRANQALGRLDGITLLLPDPEQFLYSYVRKEAVLSSQIEGTQSSLSDLLLFEADAAPGVPTSDARETSNYIAAMNHGLELLRGEGLPICNRLFREVHGVLLGSGRGSEKTPGRFRHEQNWIGEARLRREQSRATDELDRRVAPVDRALRATALGGGRAGDARAGEIPPRPA